MLKDMRLLLAAASTALCLIGIAPVTAAAEPLSEPTACVRLAAVASEKLGWDLRVGMLVDLCAGTTDARKTVACFGEAYGHPKEGGLGLTLGQAVKLCKANSTPAN